MTTIRERDDFKELYATVLAHMAMKWVNAITGQEVK